MINEYIPVLPAHRYSVNFVPVVSTTHSETYERIFCLIQVCGWMKRLHEGPVSGML